MSHAAAERENILKAVRQTYSRVHSAGRDYAAAYQQAIAKDDLVEAMACMVEVIIAADALQKAATEAAKTARSTLAATMNDSGATQIATSHHLAYLSRKPPFVQIDPDKTIPAEYLHHPPPIPDKAKIKAAIADGEEIAFAAMVQPNEMQLSIRSRSAKP
jgi:hypothetical protein